MENTTRKVAGEVVFKSNQGVLKNVLKNVLGETILTTSVWVCSFTTAKVFEYES